MNYHLHTTSLKAWDAMIRAINSAQKSIYIEMYIFLDDTKKSHDFIGKLRSKARAGVHVIIVADAYGSKELKIEIANTIAKSGIEFIFFSHWLRHIHRKILIVDEKIAFIGGVNIGKIYKNWTDLQLELRGRIVKKLLKSFAYTYVMAGGKNKKILGYREKKLVGKLKFWLLEHWPTRNIYTLKKHYVEKISKASRSIQIATPYFTPPRWLISLLDDAVRRGAVVEILIPKTTDHPQIMNPLNYRYVDELYSLGIKFYLSKTMNHSKLLIIDEEEGLIGSQNMDLFSFGLNSEVGVFFREKKLLQELEQVFEKWKKQATKFEPKKYKMRTSDYLALALLKIFRPIL
ncbi:MAG: phosphatidylserine/phosphatidylglycerophosphate/cardiolipin synthase family protein [Parcubacteria group bacterium]|jgi:cardiolipin synthase